MLIDYFRAILMREYMLISYIYIDISIDFSSWLSSRKKTREQSQQTGFVQTQYCNDCCSIEGGESSKQWHSNQIRPMFVGK